MLCTSRIPGRILIVDDEPANVRFIERALRKAGYDELIGTSDPTAVPDLVTANRPDIILMDLSMPVLDGFALLERLKPQIEEEGYLPVLVLTGDTSVATRQRALASGAKDFVGKPLELTETLLRIRNLLEARFLHLKLRDQNARLEEIVSHRTRELNAARLEAIERLALAAEYRDDDTGQHTQRVGRMAAMLAQMLGMPSDRVELLRRAAPLHDVGKIGIPDTILLKPGKLTDDEFEIMKSHTEIGGKILSGSQSPLFQMAEMVALTHHENWDGTGYPRGIAGEQIPLVGRIVAVVYVFDALTHERPYKPAWPTAKAVAEIQALSGTKFDPTVVAALVRLVQDGNLVVTPPPRATNRCPECDAALRVG